MLAITSIWWVKAKMLLNTLLLQNSDYKELSGPKCYSTEGEKCWHSPRQWSALLAPSTKELYPSFQLQAALNLAP